MQYFNDQISDDLKKGDKVKLKYFTMVRSTDRKDGVFSLHTMDHHIGDEIIMDRDLRFFAYVPSIPAFERK